MNTLFARNQPEALKWLAYISKTYKPAYIRMDKRKDGSYLIQWEEEME